MSGKLHLLPVASRTVDPPRVQGSIMGSGHWERVAACGACAHIVARLDNETPPTFYFSAKPDRLCQGCGELLSTGQSDEAGFTIWRVLRVSARFHSTSTWYLPWTWDRGTLGRSAALTGTTGYRQKKAPINRAARARRCAVFVSAFST